ncbi:Sulfotransferase 1C2-like [Homarus americanus]|uniref:Sulfotransferase 1C2-like n=1 Tax=Homarus americanus TaxID=6706 RepID=A0A8J5MQH0_HOMAM|nr:Sulfotransferase 1C2-like [Homarus americanus]
MGVIKGNESPITVEDISEEETAMREARGMRRYNLKVVRINPGNYLMPSLYKWLFQELRQNLYPGHPDVEMLNKVCPGARVEDGVQVQLAAAFKGRRILGWHLALDLLGPHLLNTCKVVYVARNPKDVCVSIYHFFTNKKSYEGNLEDCARFLLEDGGYWEHISQAWRLKDHHNLHFMFYEDMKDDLLGQLRKLNDFLKLDLSEQKLKTVMERTSFDNMKATNNLELAKANKGPGSHFRRGVAGDWKNAFTSDQNKRMDAWIKEKSQGMDIKFKYE